MVDIVVTDEFRDWYESLTDGDADSVALGVERLEQMGVTLPHPYSSQIKGSKYALRELRVQSRGRPLRIFYAFDPLRNAVLLIGGDKTGDDRFYGHMVTEAERIWDDYLKEIEKESGT